MTVKQETEEGYCMIESGLPCVVAVNKPEYDPRYPTIKSKMEESAAIDFLAEFFTGSFISRVITRIHDTGFNRSMHDIAPFENVIHESLQLMIAKHLGPSEH